MGSNDATQNHQDDDSTLNVALHCFECGTPVRLTLETPIGIGGYDMQTPVVLCGTACVHRNIARVARLWARCSCGAIVAETDLLLHKGGEIVGCPACEHEGAPLAKAITVHYWAPGAKGGALCMSDGTLKGVVTTIRRGRVNCPGCLHALIVESELGRVKQSAVLS